MRLNGCRFVLDDAREKTVHPLALEVCQAQKLPPWLALAGVHGEFELCFTLDPGREAEFLAAAAAAGWDPLRVGEVAEGEGMAFKTAGGIVPVDSGLIRNLSATAGADPREYIRSLLGYARDAGI
jgi:thiamine monophosphate kinase